MKNNIHVMPQDKYEDKKLEIMYGFHPTPFGTCLIAVTLKGVCHLSFMDEATPAAVDSLTKEWPNANLVQDQAATAELIQRIFHPKPIVSLHLKGTEFQTQVWKILATLPYGKTISYEAVAHLLGKPKAVRAVANAIARNSVAYLIPCHRVIRKSGALHKYRWGAERKKALLEYESQAAL
jgi:O-6-methylguanine DNA methyltransferase